MDGRVRVLILSKNNTNHSLLIDIFLRCGARGGYSEIINMDPAVKAELKKLSSAQLCSSALGQACMDVVVNPPRPGEPSYESFMKVCFFLNHDSDRSG